MADHSHNIRTYLAVHVDCTGSGLLTVIAVKKTHQKEHGQPTAHAREIIKHPDLVKEEKERGFWGEMPTTNALGRDRNRKVSSLLFFHVLIFCLHSIHRFIFIHHPKIHHRIPEKNLDIILNAVPIAILTRDLWCHRSFQKGDRVFEGAEEFDG